jgi:acyl-CoA dehydrogenase
VPKRATAFGPLWRESLVERLYRDNRILSIGGGSREIMNEIISKQMGL